MINVINGETPFQILSSSFSIGPSETGYELQVGADSRNFTTLFSVGANTPRMVTNVANGSYFRLKNNVGDVKVNWQRVCTDDGGGGASGTELSPVSEFPAGAEAGTVITYSGSSSAAGIYQFDGTDWVAAGGSVDLSAYYTSAQTEDAISAATAGKADAADMYIPRHTRIPLWNTQGIITGTTGYDYYNKDNTINGITYTALQSNNQQYKIYGPTTPGTAGDILVSKGGGAPVWSAMPAGDVTKAYVDSADTALQDQIDTLDEVVSAALVNLNNTKVESQDIRHMVKLTQSEYDDLSVKDPETFYIIVNNN